jgi:glutamyl-tRNA reductase
VSLEFARHKTAPPLKTSDATEPATLSSSDSLEVTKFVAALVCSHTTAPLPVREKLAIEPDKAGEFYARLRAIPGIEETVVLNTCNRVEIYVVATGTAEQTLCDNILQGLAGFRSLATGVVAAHCRWLTSDAVIRHLFHVTAGVDSQMVGETEILGQAREAYADALVRKSSGATLNRIFQKSFQAAAWAHTHTLIGRGQVSIGNVAVELATRIFGKLGSCRVLVLGTGEVGRKTAQAFASRGAPSPSVASRTFENARHLAESISGNAIPLELALSSFNKFDIIIGSATASSPLITAASVHDTIQARAGEALFLIDLGLPRNFSPDAGTIPGVYLYNLDDLSTIANENLRTRQASVELAKKSLDEKASRLMKRLSQSTGDGQAIASCVNTP